MSFFEKIHPREGTRSAKWDLAKKLYGGKDVLPMWVADMDFPVPDPVKRALIERSEHGIFGYTITDDRINLAVSGWLTRRHSWEIDHNWLMYSPGVISSLHMAVQAFTEPTDKIMIQTPVYPPFYDLVHLHNRELVKNQLHLNNGRYEVNFEEFEIALKQGVKVFILSNPHNPVGRVWTKEELNKMASLCLENNVLILSDEIHGDLVYPEHRHIPIGSLSDEINNQTITCMSPTKSFNLAGLHVSFLISPDKQKRELISKHFSMAGIKMLNTLGITALEAAYNEGEQWLEDLITILWKNKQQVERTFADRQEIHVIPAEGTYLIWLDCRKMGLSHKELKRFMAKKAKVGLNDGLSFGEEGEGFMRMNIACPPETLNEGLTRIIEALDNRQ